MPTVFLNVSKNLKIIIVLKDNFSLLISFKELQTKKSSIQEKNLNIPEILTNRKFIEFKIYLQYIL
jgi:hypothetical protein